MEGEKMKERIFEDLNILDIGNTLEISGVVYTGPKDVIIIMLPWEPEIQPHELEFMYPDLEEWEKIQRQSDIKEVELVGKTKGAKVILRKSTRQIEQHIMWKVFRRDHFKCRYCGADEVPMTVDHVVLWEEMGPSIEKNLICSCKKCNNKRGNMQYEDWIVSDQYIEVSKNLSQKDHIRNDLVVGIIPDIRANHLRQHKRNR